MRILRTIDIIIIGALLFTGIWFSTSFASEKGSTARIFVANREVARYSLDGDSALFSLETRVGTSILVRRPGAVRIIQAPCRHKICVKQGWISKTREKIICVPGRLLIQIENGGESPPSDKPFDALSF